MSRGPILRLGADLLPATSIATTPGGETAAVELDRHKSEETISGVSSLEQVERSHICSVLQKTDWVIEGERGAAKILDLHPNTLRSRMKKLGIERVPTNSALPATKSRGHEAITN